MEVCFLPAGSRRLVRCSFFVARRPRPPCPPFALQCFSLYESLVGRRVIVLPRSVAAVGEVELANGRVTRGTGDARSVYGEAVFGNSC